MRIYRGVIRAKAGELFFGFTRCLVSSWFNTLQDAEDWLYAAKSGHEHKIKSTELQERTK